MRKQLLTFSLLLCSLVSLAQNKQILYNFTAVPQSMMTNPGADVSYKFYFGVPFLSGFSANVGSTGFSAYDLFAANGVDFNTKLRTVVNETTNKDKLVLNEQLEVFNGGFRLGERDNYTYFSFGMYQELDAIVYVPKDPLVLALDGNQNYIGRSFNLGDLNAKAEAVSVLHFGFHKNITEKLILGARAKIYTSGFNVTTTKNAGYVYTIPSNNTVYEQQIYSDLQLQTSGLSNYIDNNAGFEGGKKTAKKAFLGPDLGLGFDLGFTYNPKKNIQWTGSILDIGFINHSSDAKTYTYKGIYNYQGVNPNFSNINNSGDTYQEFQDAIPLDTTRATYKTWRPIKVNASYQYSWNDHRTDAPCDCLGKSNQAYQNGVGAQLFMMSTPKAPMIALTGFYQRRIFTGLNMKATYTVDSFSYSNIGLGLSANIGAFNLYLMGDNLLAYRDLSKAKSLSFQMGLNFVFKGKEEE
ncbi:hypothetical protein FFWV33_09310 [Flavobacterium faecale]|uniref:DUF5723 domain-containing protein n=1 Tax=Flavobacterium faecale TaxID=1355330 RepID=A0A2S1LD86_9FLAO|nr:DUF5723 family protein [Flavobacterium faecale]AWG21722.1 hypothetical protein FFWV33_09310 [Flavobacterium faecale]